MKWFGVSVGLLFVLLSHGAIGQTSLPQVSQTVQLHTGWNLFSFYYTSETTGTLETFFAPLLGGADGEKPLKLIYHWQNTTSPNGDNSGVWQLHVTDLPQSVKDFPATSATIPSDINTFKTTLSDPDFTRLEKFQAYWLYLELPDNQETIPFSSSGKLEQSQITFKKGWNLMGFGGQQMLEVSGRKGQVDFESLLKGSGQLIDELYYLNADSQTGFIPTDAIATELPLAQYFSGRFVSGSGNWFLVNTQFTLRPALKTVLPPDSDFSPTTNPNTKIAGAEDVDRFRDGTIQNGDEVTSITFRFQPHEQLVEEVLPLTISNGGDGMLNYLITWHPKDLGATMEDLDLVTTTPMRDWLKVMTPTKSRLLRPDGRIDPVILERAKPLSTNPVTGFISTDIAGLTLIADRTGLPVNTSTDAVDARTGAPRLLPGKNILGEIWIDSTGGPRKKILVTVEVPPISGVFEGKAYIRRVNGQVADPAFSMDLSLSLFEDSNQRLRGVIDSERVLLYPRDVPLTGSAITDDGDRYVFTGSFYLPPGDINRYPYDRFAGDTQDNGVGDVDWNGDGKFDNINPLPKQIDRAMTLYALRQSDRSLKGDFTETVEGLTPDGMRLEGNFELNRLSIMPLKLSSTQWSSYRIFEFDRTGLTPYEEVRSTIEVDRPLRIDNLRVDVDIEHPRIADLKIYLQAPDYTQYQLFPLPGGDGSKNFDKTTSNLFETFTSDKASANTGDRERNAPDLARIRGTVAAGASLFGEYRYDTATTGSLRHIPSVIDSWFTDSVRDTLQQSYSTIAAHLAKQTTATLVRTALLHSNSKDLSIGNYIYAKSVTDQNLVASGDPTTTGSIISVLVLATPLSSSKQGVHRITSYNLGLSYPSQLLDFVDACAVPYNPGINSFAGNPTIDARQGLVLVSGYDPSSQFKSGALFLARFKVKLGNIDYSVNIAPPPTKWTLIVQDPVEGPTDPVPYPRLVRWTMRVDTSGGALKGRVVTKNTNGQISGINGATVTLLGRERLSDTVTASESGQDGHYQFGAEEFGTYTVMATHPDYQPGSAKIRFYEDQPNPFLIDDIVLEPLQGNSASTYTLAAHPYETTTSGTQPSIQIMLKGPQTDDLRERTLAFWFIKQDGTVTSAMPVGLNLTPPVVSFFQKLPAGVYLPCARISGVGVIQAPQWVIIRDTGLPLMRLQFAKYDKTKNKFVDVPPDQVDASVRFGVSRYAFYSGISDQIKGVNLNDAMTSYTLPADKTQWNYFFRDMAGFDIDRPPLATLPHAPGPQDTAAFFWMPDQVLPQPTLNDQTLDLYPKNTGDPLFAFRVFLNFNDRITGTARSIVPTPGSPPPTRGVIFHAGSMPLIVR